MKTYCKINEFKLLDIKIVLDNEKTLYEGRTEDIPKDIGNMIYSKIDMVTPITLHIFSEVTSKN